MARSDDLITTMTQFHPAIRQWIEDRAKFDTDTMSGVVRRAVREFIQRHDPDGWESLAESMRGNNEKDTPEVAADGG